MGKATKRAIAEKLEEIRQRRAAYRPFRCVPENCGAFEIQAEEMAADIEFLLEVIEERETE